MEVTLRKEALSPRGFFSSEPRASLLDTEYTECSTWYTQGVVGMVVYPGCVGRRVYQGG